MDAHRFDPANVSRMGRVYDYIHDHLSEPLPLAKLAAEAYQSPWHFQRTFKEFSGETPAEFVRRVRVERAANLLMIQKNLSVANIASECGYGSAELLARHFHERFLVSPSSWRAASQQERFRMIRQVHSKSRRSDSKGVQVSPVPLQYPWDSPVQGELTGLKLERRPEVKTIYTRHFQGYDAGTDAAFRRLRQWAEPRGLIGAKPRWIGIGLDTPWITDPERCRFLACLSVDVWPETGDGIGARSIAGGLFGVVDYRGPTLGLPAVYRELYQTMLPQAGVEAVGDNSCMEFLSTADATDRSQIHCTLALPVFSL
jgi:AraC family transcriptional regulator